ncbi:MAG: CHASE domain-containing protein, partial [Gammaproteobacteria bacterium]|nr:CHASE domain-containing protein [Gammaproteobacteria bacterium]
MTGLLVLLMVLAGAFEWQAQRQLVAQAEQDRDLVEHLAIHRAKLESVLNSKLHLVHGLAGFVRAGAQLSEASFQRFVPQLAGSLRGIRSLQLAPDGVVTYVWPLETNRKAIGHNLLDDPVRRRGAQAAIDARKLWVAGPF